MISWDMPTADRDVYTMEASIPPEGRTIEGNLFKKYADLCFQAIQDKDACIAELAATRKRLGEAQAALAQLLDIEVEQVDTVTDRLEAQRLRLVAIHEAQQAAKVRESLEKWSSLAHLRP